MFGDQRPAAPWSFNNFWGQYDTPADLPNVLGSSLQLNDVQAGDIAWVRDAGALYVCSVPTRGAAVWGPLAASVATALTDLYVAPSDPAASDANAGTTPTAPLATFDRAIELLNAQVRFAVPCTVHLASDSYTWNETLQNLSLDRPVTIICDGAGQPGDDGFTELRASAAAAAGSNQTLVVDPVGGMTVNAFQGKTILITSGAAAGDRRTVRNNTAADFVPCQRFSAAVAPGDSFRIVEPGALITTPSNGGVALASKYAVRGVGTPSTIGNVGNDARRRENLSALLLANVSLRIPTGSAQELLFGNSQIFFAGVTIASTGGSSAGIAADQQSDIVAGLDALLGTFSQFILPFTLGLATSRTSWVGWGLSLLRSGGLLSFRPQRFIGFLVWQVTSTTGLTIPNVDWFLAGGELNNDGAVNFNGAFRVAELSRVMLYGSEVPTAMRVISTGGDNRSAALRVIGGSHVGCINTELRMTGAGAAVAVHGSESTTDHFLDAGTLSLVSGITIEGARACVVVMTGGRAYWDDLPTVVGVPTIGEAVITQSATNGAAVPPSPTTFAALGDGAVIVNPDGSGTTLGRIT